MTISTSIEGQLVELAYKMTDNFCYGCYRVVDGSHCPECHSDDFMRHMDGVGVEYGTEWVIEHLIKQHCEPVDGEELFEEILDECYPEIRIGCCTFSPSDVMKELDPTAFRIGTQENLNSLAEDCQLYESEGEYYTMFDIEEMIDEIEAK